jgi:hypothetical protein
VDNVADSGDESEEEWKYFSVEPSKQAPQAFDQLLPSQEPVSSQENLQQAEPEASNNELNEPESEQCFLPEQGLPPVAPSQLLLPGTEVRFVFPHGFSLLQWFSFFCRLARITTWIPN